LTVAESKRLIAKGVAALEMVQERLEKGIIVVTNGSTNACIYEELTGTRIDHRAYIMGPPCRQGRQWLGRQGAARPGLVNGEPRDWTALPRWTRLSAGDVYIKGPTRSTMAPSWPASASATPPAAPSAARWARTSAASCAC
jgi:hypothetical protein